MLMKIAPLFALLFVAPAFADDVSVSIGINRPGFFGEINIGSAPRPQVIYARPVVIERMVEVDSPPLYLRVPPGHEKHWSRHCAEYHACGRRVYFVQEDWYRREYEPRQRYDEDRDGDHREYRDGDRRGDRGEHEERREHEEGRGHGRGRGHDHGHDKDQDER
jgi:hypothetical protein